MTPRHRYPPDLAEYVRTHWPAGRELRLPFPHLCEALSLAYQASLTFEEARPTRFRLLLTPPEALPERGVPNEGVLRLAFDQRRALTAEQLRQLAPAVPFETSLIGAYPFEGKLQIWGIAHSGPAWLAPTWGGRQVVPNWTYDPIVHVTGPGLLAVRCAGKLIGALDGAAIVDGTVDVFDSAWLPALFAREREEVQREHAALQARAPSPTAATQLLIGRVAQQMLRRTIQLVLGSRHGGLVLVVDAPEGAPPASLAGLNLKYRFDQSEPPHRYRTLLFQLLDRLSAATTNPQVDWPDFARDTSAELEKVEQAIFELSRVFAGLAAIDGAVVLDKRWRVIGFGAEVSSEIPVPARVWRALDTEGNQREESAVEDVGTRHRAAYRFVRQHPAGLALVVSTDGGVSFVANRDGDVMSWQQTVSR
jgi:DisA bacterial checkpoint controller nucleotide-binding